MLFIDLLQINIEVTDGRPSGPRSQKYRRSAVCKDFPEPGVPE